MAAYPTYKLNKSQFNLQLEHILHPSCVRRRRSDSSSPTLSQTSGFISSTVINATTTRRGMHFASVAMAMEICITVIDYLNIWLFVIKRWITKC